MLKNKSKAAAGVVFVLVFAVMFVMNFLTPMVADDFLYRYNFSNDEIITGVSQIFPSMYAHAHEINGRIFAHFFVQFFDLLPTIVFDIVNSLFFTALIYLIYRISGAKEKSESSVLKGIIFPATIFSAMWVFPLSFADSLIWLSGSCNYLWGAVICLAFLTPYVEFFNQSGKKHSLISKLGFVVFSVLAGGWVENISSAVVFLAVAILVVSRIYQKKKPDWYHVAGIIAAFLGFLVMALAPAELHGKIREFYIWDYVYMFKRAITAYSELYILIFSFVFLLIFAIVKKVSTDRIILSVIFVLGSLFSNLILIFGVFMPSRTQTGVVVFLIIANMILFTELAEKTEIIAYSSSVILILTSVFFVFIGGIDAVTSYSEIKDNEEYILSCKEKGILDISIPIVEPETKYSNGYNLNPDEPDDYPNDSIAKYYGLNSILGIESEEAQEK